MNKYDNQYITEIAEWIINNHNTRIEEIIFLLKKKSRAYERDAPDIME